MSFQHQCWLVDCLSDCKSPQISRTLLSIPADLNTVIICIVSVHPLIPISSNLFFFFFETFGNCSKGSNYNWYHCQPHVAQFFLLSGKIQELVNLFAIIFILGFVGIAKSVSLVWCL